VVLEARPERRDQAQESAALVPLGWEQQAQAQRALEVAPALALAPAELTAKEVRATTRLSIHRAIRDCLAEQAPAPAPER
jgi:hypothetical protein